MTHFLKIIEAIEKKRIEVDRHNIVKIVAVSKYTDSSSISAIYSCGQRAFGESRVQDLEKKRIELDTLPLEWHFIGRLQENKINKLLEIRPFLFHSLDSLDLAAKIDKRVSGKPFDALLQINSAYEESKAGFSPEEAKEAYLNIKESYKNINLKGIMTIGAHSSDRDKVKKSFEKAKSVYEELKNEGATVLSMGMSSDFLLAIECGSNMLRLGSILFSRN